MQYRCMININFIIAYIVIVTIFTIFNVPSVILTTLIFITNPRGTYFYPYFTD